MIGGNITEGIKNTTRLQESKVQINTRKKTLKRGQKVVRFTMASIEKRRPRQAGTKPENPAKQSAGELGME